MLYMDNSQTVNLFLYKALVMRSALVVKNFALINFKCILSHHYIFKSKLVQETLLI